MDSRSFSSSGGTALKTGLVLTIVVVVVAAMDVLPPWLLAAIWVGGLVAAIPLRWTPVALVPEGITVQRGFDFLTRRHRFIHDSQIRGIKQILTEQLSLLLVQTHDGQVRIETADLPRRALIEALEERYGPIEILHTFVAPFGPLKR